MKNNKKELNCFHKSKNIQDRINKLANKYKNKKIVLYGTGKFFDFLIESYDFSAINIVAVSDIMYHEESDYRGYRAIPDRLIVSVNPDVVLMTTMNYSVAEKYFKEELFNLYGKFNYEALINKSVTEKFKDIVSFFIKILNFISFEKKIKSALSINPTQNSLKIVNSAKKHILTTAVCKNPWAFKYAKMRFSDKYRYAVDLDILKKYLPDGGDVCEHGAAPFILSSAIQKAGYNLTATDIAPQRFGDLSDMPFSIIEYNVDSPPEGLAVELMDAVLFNELFEHCRHNLVLTMSSVYKTLKPGGFLMLCTPNLKSLSGIYNFLFNDTAYAVSADIHTEWNKLNQIGHMGHVREYTPKEVCDFLKKCGFEIKEVIYRDNYEKTGISNFCKSLVTKVNKEVLPLFSVIAQKPISSTQGVAQTLNK